MINDIDGVKFLLARLSGLRGYPREPVARAELARIACQTANELDDVRRAVDSILADWDKCPVPSELRKAIFEAMPPRPKIKCALCYGSGFLVDPYLITRERDPLTGHLKKTVVKITRAEERELAPQLSELYKGLALAPQEIVDSAVKCGCRA
jgi:hypothetical protein